MNQETLFALFSILDFTKAVVDAFGYSDVSRQPNASAVELGELVGEFLKRYASHPSLMARVTLLLDRYLVE